MPHIYTRPHNKHKTAAVILTAAAVLKKRPARRPAREVANYFFFGIGISLGSLMASGPSSPVRMRTAFSSG